MTSNESTDIVSLLDIFAQEQLLSSIKAAFEFVAKVFYTNFPAHFTSLYRFSDEILTILHFFIEKHYLTNYNSTFTENMYGLERMSLKDAPLRKFPSLFVIVLVPYISKKFYLLYEKLKDKTDQINSSKQSFKKTLAKCILHFYPIFHTVSHLCSFLFQLSYGFGYSSYHSLSEKLIGFTLSYSSSPNDNSSDVRLTEEDTDRAKNSLVVQKMGLTANLKRLLYKLLELLPSFSLQSVLFSLQVVNWFHENGYLANFHFKSLPLPEYPKYLLSNEDRKDTCPICKNKRHNDTVLSTSGYVFCYTCIARHLAANDTCPVTGYTSNNTQLVRLYLDQGPNH